MVASKKLLVVDDDPYIVITIRVIFEEEGFEVYAVNSGAECLEFLENEDFMGVVLMDLMMPGMTGWETIEAMVKKGLHKNVVISVLSAKDIPDEKPESMKYIVDYLNKPFDNDEIINKVNSYFVSE